MGGAIEVRWVIIFSCKREMGEEGIVRALVILVLVSSGLAEGQNGQSTTPFKECYVGCFIYCIIVPPHSAFDCSLQCLRDCIFPKNPQGVRGDNPHFCKLGCASSLCTSISTKQNPGGEKVENCVVSCSEVCRKNYLSP